MTHKIFIVVLMLVAFVGQPLASTAMSCTHQAMNVDMSLMDHGAMTGATMMADSSRNTNMSVNEGNGAMDCCQEQCQCPMSGCVSLSILVSNTLFVSTMAAQKIYQLSPSHQSQVNASLYRPPIS